MTEKQEVTTMYQVSNKAYDVLSAMVRLILPGLATLYLALATIWGFPGAEQVAGTITAFTVFLGIFLEISKRKYVGLESTQSDGDLLVDVNEAGEQALTVALEKPLGDVRTKDRVVFTVVRTNTD